MSTIFGTSSNYQAFADRLSEVVTGISLKEVTAIAAAGTGYSVGDQLTLSGGTSTIAAIAEVTEIGGSGEVVAVHILNAGLYQTAPSSPVSTTGGGGSGCTLTCVFGSNGWTRRMAINVAGAAQSATVAAGGTGYVVGDTLTLSGGTSTVAAQFQVATIGGSGEVLTVTLAEPGAYTSNPSNPVSTTGGTGSGCTLDVTFGGSGERSVIVEGEGSGSDEIFVGWQTYPQTGGNGAMELLGATGFNAGLDWHEQPGANPNRQSPGTPRGAIVPLANITISWWINVNPRRIVFVSRVSSYYGSGYLGLINPFATAGEWPYPIYVCGSCDEVNLRFSSTAINLSGITEPISTTNNEDQNSKGPGMLRLPDGTWYDVASSSLVIGTRAQTPFQHRIVPTAIAAANNAQDEDRFFVTAETWAGLFIPTSGVPGNVFNTLLPTVNSTGNIYPLVPCGIAREMGNANEAYHGELDGVFWLDSNDTLVPENRLFQNGERYRVFRAGNRSERWAHWALRED